MNKHTTSSVGVNTPKEYLLADIFQCMEAAALPKSAKSLYLALLTDCGAGSLISTLKYKKMGLRANIHSDSTKVIALAILQLFGFITKRRKGRYLVHRLKKIRNYPWIQELAKMSKKDRKREIEEILSLPNTPLKYNITLITHKLREETARVHAHEEKKLSVSLKFNICYLYTRLFYRYEGEPPEPWERAWGTTGSSDRTPKPPKKLAKSDKIFVAVGIMQLCDKENGWQRIVKNIKNRLNIIRNYRIKIWKDKRDRERSNAFAETNQNNDSMRRKFLQNMCKIKYSEIRRKAILQLRDELKGAFQEGKFGLIIDVYVHQFAKNGSFM